MTLDYYTNAVARLTDTAIARGVLPSREAVIGTLSAVIVEMTGISFRELAAYMDAIADEAGEPPRDTKPAAELPAVQWDRASAQGG